jgi:hypothetical protein
VLSDPTVSRSVDGGMDPGIELSTAGDGWIESRRVGWWVGVGQVAPKGANSFGTEGRAHGWGADRAYPTTTAWRRVDLGVVDSMGDGSERARLRDEDPSGVTTAAIGSSSGTTDPGSEARE